MPKRCKKPCKHSGCPNLTDGQYCDEHISQHRKEEEKYRDPHGHKKYGPDWPRTSKAYKEHHPYCELCFKKGIMVKVEEVHHIVPKRDGGGNEESNLMGLCRSCHGQIHSDMGHRKRGEYSYKK